MSKKILTIILIMTFMLSAAGCTKKLKGGQPESPVESNGLVAAKQGDWYYYINGGMPSLADYAMLPDAPAQIFRMKDEVREQITKHKAFDFYIYGDKIFYISPNTTYLDLYCIGIDGTKDKKLAINENQGAYHFGNTGVAVENNKKVTYVDYKTLKKTVLDTGNVEEVRVYNDYVYCYFTNKAEIIRYATNGSGTTEKLTSKNGNIISITDTDLYFAQFGETLYKVDFNTLEQKQITNSTYSKMRIANGVMVGKDKEKKGLFVMPFTETIRTQIHERSVGEYYIGEKYIFFSDTEKAKIYRSDLNGQNVTLLCDGTVRDQEFSIDQAGDYLFYFDTMGNPFYVSIEGGTPVSLLEVSK